MPILTQVPNIMQEILQNRANEIAQRCGLVQRIRKLTGAGFIQTLVFGWLEDLMPVMLILPIPHRL